MKCIHWNCLCVFKYYPCKVLLKILYTQGGKKKLLKIWKVLKIWRHIQDTQLYFFGYSVNSSWMRENSKWTSTAISKDQQAAGCTSALGHMVWNIIPDNFKHSNICEQKELNMHEIIHQKQRIINSIENITFFTNYQGIGIVLQFYLAPKIFIKAIDELDHTCMEQNNNNNKIK